MSKYKIIDEVVIDDDLHIKVMLRANSPYWYIQYNLPGIGQKKHSLKTKSKKEAVSKGRAFARDFAAGEVQAGSIKRYTVQEVADLRCNKQTNRDLSPKTIAHAKRFDRQLMIFLPKGGATPIQGLTTPVLEAFEDELRTTGIAIPSTDGRGKRKAGPLKPKSLRDAMKSTRGLIGFALKRGMIKSDPSSAYELPPEPEPEIIAFSAEELNALYEDPAPGLAAIWRLLTQTCLRIGEFMWLMKQDVLVNDAGYPVALKICKKVCPFTGKTWKPKHGIERQVPLTAEAAEIVASALKSSEVPWLFQSPVSRGKQTGMWTYNPLRTHLQARQDAAGMKRTGLHRFRHTGATYLANDARMPTAQLRDFLGHKDLKMTERYLHPRPEHIQSTIAHVDFDCLINNSVASATMIDTEKGENPKTVNSQSTPEKAACATGV